MFFDINWSRLKIDLHKKKTKISLRLFSDSAEARTQDPILKRDVLYQLSY
jgi:hypothetical protein